MLVDVCVVRMEAGEQTTETEVIVGGVATLTVAVPDRILLTVAVPVHAEVRSPAPLTVPMLMGLTDHLPVEL